MAAPQPMIGPELGHYRILERIGSGGMGVVFRAHDENLDRDVALKVLPAGALPDESTRRRFRKEALALSRLNHPNIETVHDFSSASGVDFLVIELIQGITLSGLIANGPLPEAEVLRIAAQLADGLAAAHARGVIHCDINPNNVRLTPEGRLKILDFGLARISTPGFETATSDNVDGHAGPASGTLPYMSPEQLRGKEVDARTDIWAFGVVLYELSTGRRPFADLGSVQLMESILKEPVTPPREVNPALSEGLEQIILKSLQKDLSQRYQSVAEVVRDLRRLSGTEPRVGDWRVAGAVALCAVLILALTAAWVGWNWPGSPPGTVAVPPEHSIAVLPLEDLSGPEAQDYFADGITDALISELARVNGLRVISRQSVARYKHDKKPLADIARELNVTTVLEGSVLRAGGRVGITANLIDAVNDRHLWTATYERELEDVLVLRREVATAIALELRLQLSPEMRADPQRVRPDAHEAYLRGRKEFDYLTVPGWRRALEHFEQAVKLDPQHAMAHAALAETLFSLEENTLSTEEVYARAGEAARRALELDPALPDGHAARAWAQWKWDGDWAAARQGFETAIRLAPGAADARDRYGRFLLALGRFDDAAAEMRRAQELDPLSVHAALGLTAAHYYAGRHPEAIAILTKVRQEHPQVEGIRFALAFNLGESGAVDEALAELEALAAAQGSSAAVMTQMAYLHARAGRAEKAREIMQELRKMGISLYQSAVVETALGDLPAAFAHLERAYQQRDTAVVWMAVDPRLRPLRSDARFDDLVQRIRSRPPRRQAS